MATTKRSLLMSRVLSPVHENPNEESHRFSPSSTDTKFFIPDDLHVTTQPTDLLQVDTQSVASTMSISTSYSSSSRSDFTITRPDGPPDPTRYAELEEWLDSYDLGHLAHPIGRTLGITLPVFASLQRKNVRKLIFSDAFKTRFTNEDLMQLFQAVLDLLPYTSPRQDNEEVPMTDEEQQIMIRVKQDERSIQKSIENMEEIRQEIFDNAQKRERFIQEQIADCIAQLKKRENLLLGRVQDIVDHKIKILDEQLEQLREQLPIFENASKVQQRILQYEDMGQVARKVNLQEISDSMHAEFGKLKLVANVDSRVPVEFNKPAFANSVKILGKVPDPSRVLKARSLTVADVEEDSVDRAAKKRRPRAKSSLIDSLKLRKDSNPFRGRSNNLTGSGSTSPSLFERISSTMRGGNSPANSSTEEEHTVDVLEFSELPRRTLKSLDVATRWSAEFMGQKMVVSKSNPQMCKSRRGLGWCSNTIRVQDPLPRDSRCSWRIVFRHGGYRKGEPIQQANFIGVVGETFRSFDMLVSQMNEKKYVCGIDCDGKYAYPGDGSEAPAKLNGKIGWNEEIEIRCDGETGRIQFWNVDRGHTHLKDLCIPDEGSNYSWYPAVSMDVPGNIRCQITFL